MRLEADDGRPEASPPLRGVVQAADRAALRTPERNEPVELCKRNGQLEMEVDVSEQAAPVFARR